MNNHTRIGVLGNRVKSELPRFAGFEWVENKNEEHKQKHGLSFESAQFAFADPYRIVVKDLEHGKEEE